jgi:hypothetical protein
MTVLGWEVNPDSAATESYACDTISMYSVMTAQQFPSKGLSHGV